MEGGPCDGCELREPNRISAEALAAHWRAVTSAHSVRAAGVDDRRFPFDVDDDSVDPGDGVVTDLQIAAAVPANQDSTRELRPRRGACLVAVACTQENARRGLGQLVMSANHEMRRRSGIDVNGTRTLSSSEAEDKELSETESERAFNIEAADCATVPELHSSGRSKIDDGRARASVDDTDNEECVTQRERAIEREAEIHALMTAQRAGTRLERCAEPEAPNDSEEWMVSEDEEARPRLLSDGARDDATALRPRSRDRTGTQRKRRRRTGRGVVPEGLHQVHHSRESGGLVHASRGFMNHGPPDRGARVSVTSNVSARSKSVKSK